MATVTLRELARNTASVIQGIQTSRRPALVTRNGKPVVALVPIDEVALEDWLLRESAAITSTAVPAGPGAVRGGRHDA
jgi:prevent-host-death family protein